MKRLRRWVQWTGITGFLVLLFGITTLAFSRIDKPMPLNVSLHGLGLADYSRENPRRLAPLSNLIIAEARRDIALARPRATAGPTPRPTGTPGPSPTPTGPSPSPTGPTPSPTLPVPTPSASLPVPTPTVPPTPTPIPTPTLPVPTPPLP